MSAFMCSDDHIKLLAVWHNSSRGLDLDGINVAVECLYNANQRSLGARYGDSIDDQGPKVTLDDINRLSAVAPVVVLKQVDCFAYQACEFEGWESSTACQMLDSITHNAVSALPGYDEAAWGI